jgi:hypothetical protein
VRQACEPNGKLYSLRLRFSPSFDSLNVGGAPLVAIIDSALLLRVVRYTYARLSCRSKPCPPDSFTHLLEQPYLQSERVRIEKTMRRNYQDWYSGFARHQYLYLAVNKLQGGA